MQSNKRRSAQRRVRNANFFSIFTLCVCVIIRIYLKKPGFAGFRREVVHIKCCGQLDGVVYELVSITVRSSEGDCTVVKVILYNDQTFAVIIRPASRHYLLSTITWSVEVMNEHFFYAQSLLSLVNVFEVFVTVNQSKPDVKVVKKPDFICLNTVPANCSNICVLREEIVHCGVAQTHQILLSF